jgi:hypothetical protein
MMLNGGTADWRSYIAPVTLNRARKLAEEFDLLPMCTKCRQHKRESAVQQFQTGYTYWRVFL